MGKQGKWAGDQISRPIRLLETDIYAYHEVGTCLGEIEVLLNMTSFTSVSIGVAIGSVTYVE